MSYSNLNQPVIKNGRVYVQLPQASSGNVTIRKKASTTTLAGTPSESFTIPLKLSVDTDGIGYQGGVPRLTLDMTNVQLQAVNREVKVPITCTFANGYGSTYTERIGKVTIKGRGNTSWTYPQKPYAIALADSAGKADINSLFGFYADSDIVLLANYADPTGGLRTYMVHELAKRLGLVAVKNLFIEVYTSDGYQGLYLMTEKIKNTLVNLVAPTTVGTPEQYGYMYETVLDFQETLSEENYFKTALFGDNYPGPTHLGTPHSVIITYPKGTKLTSPQAVYAKQIWDNMESSLNYDWTDLVNGPQAFLDKPNMFAFIATMEFSRNVDMISHSFVTYQQPGEKMKFLLWDMDLAFPVYTTYAFDGNSPTNAFISRCPIFKTLFSDADFRTEFSTYFTNTASQQLYGIIESATQRAQLLLDTGAISRSMEKWQTTSSPMAVFNKNYVTNPAYDAHLQALIEFATTRAGAMTNRYSIQNQSGAKLFTDSIVEVDNTAGVIDSNLPDLANQTAVTIFSIVSNPNVNNFNMLAALPQTNRQTCLNISVFQGGVIGYNTYTNALNYVNEATQAFVGGKTVLIESTVLNSQGSAPNGNFVEIRVNSELQTFNNTNGPNELRLFSDTFITGGGINDMYIFNGYVKNFLFYGNMSVERRAEIRDILKLQYPQLP